MEVNADLIKRFLENRCTQEEAALVHEYLLAHKDQLDKWLPEEEWESFEAGIKLPAVESNSWFKHIEQEKKGARIISPAWLRIAAAVLIAVSFVVVYQFVHPTHKKTITKIIKPQIPATTARIFRNNNEKNVTYTLDDGSTVILHAKSMLICNQPFDSTKRKLTLHGEATFYVAKDTSRPFMVFTKGFSTTALGTVFRIKAYDSSSTSTVQLIEGKVVLQNLHHPEKPMYLHPGDEYSFSYKDNRFRSITPKAHVPVKTVAPIHVDGNITETTAEISFSNTPLPDVLKKISEVYDIRIDMDSAQLEGRKFTGSFLKKQAANDVLATIAGLNNYTVVYDGTVYRLTVQ